MPAILADCKKDFLVIHLTQVDAVICRKIAVIAV
jgi:hypothetical protein